MQTTTEEHYAILDTAGNPTGEVLPKSVVHERELLHGSIFVWIYNARGEVLVQLRAKDKKCFPDVWDVSVAGHISAEDTPLQTAVREVEEEIGLKIAEAELTQVGFTSDVVPWIPDKTHHEICWVYILHKELNPSDLALQKEELTATELQSIATIEAARLQRAHEKIYANRNPKIYESAFAAIKERLPRPANQ